MQISGGAAPTVGPGIVGREPELDRIEAFLGEVPNGARSLLLHGEAGIGKSVLWRWAIDRARALGYRVITARPAEEELVIPLAALADLLEGVDVAAVALAPDSDQLARGRAVLEALRDLAATTPAIVAIDDAQWLDTASARALRFGLRRLDSEPVGLLIAAREAGEPEDPFSLGATSFPGGTSRVLVGPLSIDSIRSLLAGTVRAIARPTLRRIHHMSAGNPFYALELAGYLADRGGERLSSGPGLPASLRSVIAGRLTGLPVDLSRLLGVVAVLGRAPFAILEAVLPEMDLAAAVAEGRARRLLIEEKDGDVRFSHALLSSAVYEAMSNSDRVAWHAALAAVMRDPDQRAWHVAVSTQLPDEVVAAMIEEAADRAASRGAPDVAAQLAFHSTRLTPPELAETLRRRTFAHVEHLAGAGDVGRAQSVAEDLIAGLPPGPARAEALVRRWEMDDDPAVNEAWLWQALEEAQIDDRLRVRILIALGRGREYLGDLQGGIDACRDALDVAERVGDPSVEMDALTSLAYLETKSGTPRFDLMDRAMALEHDLRMPVASQSPSELQVGMLLWHGELEEARRMLAATRAAAEQAGLEWKSLQHDYGLAILECLAGNLEVAHEAVSRAMVAARDADDAWSERVMLFPFGLIEAWLGRTDSARAAAEQMIQDARGMRLAIVNGRKVLGLLALAAGDWRTASVELVEASMLSEESGVAHPGVDRQLPDTVEAVALSGDFDAARSYLERLERQALAVAGPWPETATLRARGAFLLAVGEADDSADVLGEAVARFDELGFRPDAARSRLLEGRALGRAGHRSRGAEALADAYRRFEAIGAAGWQEKTAAELERLAPGRTSGVLTPTESRIAALIAEGLRNREISESLFMSVATVEAHLTRIYRKLEIRSRTELSRLVASGDLDLAQVEVP